MDRDQGLRILGLSGEATALDVHRAYKTRSRALKLQVLGAPRAEVKERFRADLRDLVEAREAALGRREPPQWRRRPTGVSGRRLIEMMRATSPVRLDKHHARAFFRLGPEASNEQVLKAYRLCSRALIQRFAVARDDDEMSHIRRARSKLRTIRNFALASA